MTPNHFIRKTLLVAASLLTLSAGVFANRNFTTGDNPGGTKGTTPAPASTISDNTISDKLLQAFKQTFPDAIQVKWVEEPTRYTVSFKQNDILTKVEYDKDGNFVSSLRYYSEKNLPVTVLCQLQKKYAGKTIFGVTELATEASTEYYIKLVDDHNWMTVRSDADGNMQLVEKYKKAS
jgi:hypothetical protein